MSLVVRLWGDVTDEERIVPGRWVAENPQVRGLRGYWIPPLAFPFVDLTRLAANAVSPEPSEREQFFQQDLGMPYTLAGSKLTLEMLLSLNAERWVRPGDTAQWASTSARAGTGVSSEARTGASTSGRSAPLTPGTTLMP